MHVRVVESKQNARLKELRRALRGSGLASRGRVAIEGPHLVEEALRAGLRVGDSFCGGRFRAPASTRCPCRLRSKFCGCRANCSTSALATETPQPVAALVEPPNWSWQHILNQDQKKALVVVLAGLQDPGNLGTILRSAEAFGATGVVSLPGTVSAWNPKAVRASAGSVFRVPLVEASEKECFELLREAGVKVLSPPPCAPPSPPISWTWLARSLFSSATRATACRRNWPRWPTPKSQFPAPARSKA